MTDTAGHPPDPEESTSSSARYVLLGPDRRPYLSCTPGWVGGHRRNRIYGQLDCRAALRAISAGGTAAQVEQLIRRR